MESAIYWFAWIGIATSVALFAFTALTWALWAYEKLPGTFCIHLGNFMATMFFVRHWLWMNGDTDNVKVNAGRLLYQRLRVLKERQPIVADEFIKQIVAMQSRESEHNDG